METILNPVVPFFVSLPGGQIYPGQTIVILGETHHAADRFAINLIQARSVIQSCLLHFDIRFDQCETVRNTNYPTGAWAHEETSPLPIVRGRNFCIEIKCLPGHFTIMIDGQYHCDFNHRFSMSEADALQVAGDVKIHNIQFK